MSQVDPPPIGDILKKAESEGYSTLEPVQREDTLRTREDIQTEPSSKSETQQGHQDLPSGENINSRTAPTESSVQTEEPVDAKSDKDANEPASANTTSNSVNPPTTHTPSDSLMGNWSEVGAKIGSIEQNVRILADSSIKITGEVREMHKLYHNEYAARLKSMQDELERYREIDKGRIFDGILSDVAKLYSDYESVIDDITDEKIKKRIRYMLEDIVQILQANGVQKQKSATGDKRNTRHCQVIERVMTNNPEQHDTVAKSRGTGFYIENRSLIKEPVDICLYTETAEEKSAQL